MKRKGARSKAVANSSVAQQQEHVQVELQRDNNNENEGDEGGGFFACYLLTSLSPRFKGHTYIGFTVNPRRRIRQHNGEIGSGAWRTKSKRPWEMVLCIYGFPTNVSALQFEWAWQHPIESLAVRKAAVGFKSLSGVANKIKLAYTMLTLPSWESMDMTVNFFSTKYMKHCAGCPDLPQHMTVEIGSMDELPCYTERVDGMLENEDDDNNELEFGDNNASTSNSVPDACDDSVTADSPKNPSHGENISEPFGWNKESEATEPPSHMFTPFECNEESEATELSGHSFTPFEWNKESEVTELPGHSFTPREHSEPFDSILSRKGKASSVIEKTDFISSTIKSNAESSKTDSEQTGASDVRGAFFVPHQADIIDLSTPSPSCRNDIEMKKRRVSSTVSSEFIDLTKSPNFIQLVMNKQNLNK
ncbi:hypothetical protein KIW84_054309 [Lathyrus oleraceus]|uniref:Structure-specific endonuclease subunit SLX1 homolog n=1 Tax=Pisum sativum TaxID=3888 RepID=A0A9D5AHB5_PEA|nr:hypothetical protein KIW84_054309 [Pisum sativum]